MDLAARLIIGLFVAAVSPTSEEGLNLAGTPPARIAGSIDRTVAVTFDDLPGTALTPEQRCSSESLLAVSKRILAPFRREGWPVAGFVTESRLCEQLADEDLTRVLRFWIDSGAELGNHTFGHVDLNDETAESFIADIERGERVLRGLLEEAGQRPRYFRYPYLHAGNTREKWTRVRAWLASRNYVLGVVTMDNQEWVYSSVYARAKARDDRAVMAEVMAGYLAHLSESVEYFERLSQERFGRNIPHVLLLHANALNADGIEDVVRLLRERGYEFESLGSVLTDEAYSSPDHYIGERGLSWLHRWSVDERGQSALEPRESPRVRALLQSYGRD